MNAPPENIDAGEVTLRRQRVGDATAIAVAVAASLDHLSPWMAWAVPEAGTEIAQRARLDDADRDWDAGTNYGFLVERDGVVVGIVGLHRRIGPGAIEVGYWIHAGHAGHGYATAAAGAVTDAALALDDIERVEIHCDEANVRSAAIPPRLGFALDRVEDDDVEAPGEIGRGMVWIKRRTA